MSNIRYVKLVLVARIFTKSILKNFNFVGKYLEIKYADK